MTNILQKILLSVSIDRKGLSFPCSQMYYYNLVMVKKPYRKKSMFHPKCPYKDYSSQSTSLNYAQNELSALSSTAPPDIELINFMHCE